MKWPFYKCAKKSKSIQSDSTRHCTKRVGELLKWCTSKSESIMKLSDLREKILDFNQCHFWTNLDCITQWMVSTNFKITYYLFSKSSVLLLELDFSKKTYATISKAVDTTSTATRNSVDVKKVIIFAFIFVPNTFKSAHKYFYSHLLYWYTFLLQSLCKCYAYMSTDR